MVNLFVVSMTNGYTDGVIQKYQELNRREANRELTEEAAKVIRKNSSKKGTGLKRFYKKYG